MLTARQRYYAKNKSNEEFQAKNRAMRKAYYEAHKDQEREKALARYYKRKELQVPAGETPPAPVEV